MRSSGVERGAPTASSPARGDCARRCRKRVRGRPGTITGSRSSGHPASTWPRGAGRGPETETSSGPRASPSMPRATCTSSTREMHVFRSSPHGGVCRAQWRTDGPDKYRSRTAQRRGGRARQCLRRRRGDPPHPEGTTRRRVRQDLGDRGQQSRRSPTRAGWPSAPMARSWLRTPATTVSRSSPPTGSSWHRGAGPEPRTVNSSLPTPSPSTTPGPCTLSIAPGTGSRSSTRTVFSSGNTIFWLGPGGVRSPIRHRGELGGCGLRLRIRTTTVSRCLSPGHQPQHSRRHRPLPHHRGSRSSRAEPASRRTRRRWTLRRRQRQRGRTSRTSSSTSTR